MATCKPPASTHPIRIAFLVDQPLLGLGIEALLSRSPEVFRIVAAPASVPEAAVQAAAADIVVVDIDSFPDAVRAIAACGEARVVALTGSEDALRHDEAVIAGAAGIVHKRDAIDTLLKAAGKVHAGEMWLDRHATRRVLSKLSGKAAEPAPHPEAKRLRNLTERERQVIHALIEDAGASTRQIAARLRIRESTLRNHLSTVYDKLQLSGRLELFAFASRHLAPAGRSP
jgi:DNA-binding NarL/FixJ family response regulator